jgi:hypothetical protein
LIGSPSLQEGALCAQPVPPTREDLDKLALEAGEASNTVVDFPFAFGSLTEFDLHLCKDSVESFTVRWKGTRKRSSIASTEKILVPMYLLFQSRQERKISC